MDSRIQKIVRPVIGFFALCSVVVWNTLKTPQLPYAPSDVVGTPNISSPDGVFCWSGEIRSYSNYSVFLHLMLTKRPWKISILVRKKMAVINISTSDFSKTKTRFFVLRRASTAKDTEEKMLVAGNAKFWIWNKIVLFPSLIQQCFEEWVAE